MGGKQLLAVAPKDGHLHGYDLATNTWLYRVPVTTVENADAPFRARAESVRFCPGPVGGDEWNTSGLRSEHQLDPVGRGRLVLLRSQYRTTRSFAACRSASPSPESHTLNPFNMFGDRSVARTRLGGWVYATDADTGVWKWRAKSNFPVVGGITPTAGGVVFFGDLGGNFYALDSSTGQKLLGQSDRRRHRRRRDHLYREWRAKNRRGRRFHDGGLADEVHSAKVVILGMDDSGDAMMRVSTQRCLLEARHLAARSHALRSRLPVAHAICVRHQFPHHLSGLHDRAGGMARDDRRRSPLSPASEVYRRVFDFWLKIFALSFGMGVVTGIVMAFQFGTNWGVLAEKTGSIQGPLLGYEAFTAFMLEATFFGVMLLGRNRVSPRFYFFACCMVSLGNDVLLVLDPRQQQLDAGAARPFDRRRQDHSRRTGGRSSPAR